VHGVEVEKLNMTSEMSSCQDECDAQAILNQRDN